MGVDGLLGLSSIIVGGGLLKLVLSAPDLVSVSRAGMEFSRVG
jgi:hypothetical protein